MAAGTAGGWSALDVIRPLARHLPELLHGVEGQCDRTRRGWGCAGGAAGAAACHGAQGIALWQVHLLPHAPCLNAADPPRLPQPGKALQISLWISLLRSGWGPNLMAASMQQHGFQRAFAAWRDGSKQASRDHGAGLRFGQAQVLLNSGLTRLPAELGGAGCLDRDLRSLCTYRPRTRNRPSREMSATPATPPITMPARRSSTC